MSKRTYKGDPPDDPASVGYAEARTVCLVGPDAPLALESGAILAPVDVEYETYGELNATRDNAVLITHALSGDAHVAGWDRAAETNGRAFRAGAPGWWDAMIGPGKPIDTRRFFVICSNVLGGCYGTTGPASPDPATGVPYGPAFPTVTVGDWVRVQALLLDHLGIARLRAVVGGSLGGQQALEWALAYPERVERAVVLAASARLSAQGLGFNAVGRFSIVHDPDYGAGHYYATAERGSHRGLAAARMLAHITYLADIGMDRKFGRRRRAGFDPQPKFGIEFEVESYLDHQGRKFVQRFDANSYLYITRAMDYYDAAEKWGGGDLVEACRRLRSRMMVVSFSSDWLYPPAECRELALAVCRVGRPVTYVNVPSEAGHDAFLVEADKVGRLLRPFLAGEEPA